jgi:hypothetical protein
MSEPKFTPGPWKVWKDMDPKEPRQIIGMETDFICEISEINTNRDANAHLLAAAPELYAVLWRMASDPRIEPYHREIKATLAKANGGAQ